LFSGHYQYDRAEYNAKMNTLCQEAKHQGINLELLPGFEIFLQNGIEEDVVKHNLCLGDSSYILVETELNGLPSDFYENIFKLLRKGYKPILAHAERYVSLMNRPAKVEALIERDIYIQVNSGSLLGQYGNNVMNTAWDLVEHGYVHFLGSDDHVRSDYSSFFQARQSIEDSYDSYTADLLTLKNGTSVLNNKKVEYKYLLKREPRHHKQKKKSLLARIFG
ncbi:MAG: CpsB/CapC family capsule biosynthesis tyrosine phosphatase, partial [Candidatus Cloacimonadaceae bacterium]|nr:CpsB/CapC family capsule biosynthesis tyrosine phosphatase [Candidatus Cloacimonadaceae bacterium]